MRAIFALFALISLYSLQSSAISVSPELTVSDLENNLLLKAGMNADLIDLLLSYRSGEDPCWRTPAEEDNAFEGDRLATVRIKSPDGKEHSFIPIAAKDISGNGTKYEITLMASAGRGSDTPWEIRTRVLEVKKSPSSPNATFTWNPEDGDGFLLSEISANNSGNLLLERPLCSTYSKIEEDPRLSVKLKASATKFRIDEDSKLSRIQGERTLKSYSAKSAGVH
ncbi:MAG: hypothetical protein KDD25_03420 [Bdellovibrionales bacterium]|nr:hypothetical protein [Bdellovibrionales bacterium]